MNGDGSNLTPLNIFILFLYLKRKTEKKNNLSRSVEKCILKTAKDGNPRITACSHFAHRILSPAQAPPCINASARALGWGLRFTLTQLRMNWFCTSICTAISVNLYQEKESQFELSSSENKELLFLFFILQKEERSCYVFSFVSCCHNFQLELLR